MKVPFVDRSSTSTSQELSDCRICSLQWVELQRLSSSFIEQEAPRPIVRVESSNKSMFLALSGFIDSKRPMSIYYGVVQRVMECLDCGIWIYLIFWIGRAGGVWICWGWL